MGNSQNTKVKYEVKEVKKEENICSKCKKKMDDEERFNFPDCGHKCCPECLSKYLDHFESAKISCPGEGCREIIPDHIIRMVLSNSQILQYDILCYPSTKRKCLIKECQGYVVFQGTQGHFICEFCNQRNCVTCSNIHSESEPHGVSRDKSAYERKAAEMLERRARELQELAESEPVTLNPEKFTCKLYDEFVLPREGIMLKNCKHIFCRTSLQTYLNLMETFDRLKCPKCSEDLRSEELKHLLGEEVLLKLKTKAASLKHYRCKYPDCPKSWDPGSNTGVQRCEECGKENCIACEAIHEGKSCEQYKESEEYQSRLKEIKLLVRHEALRCYNCPSVFIRREGCGCLVCPGCLKQVCAFSGKELGPKGCQCRKSKPCHPKCTGCFPEGNSDEEKDLRVYYYDQ